MSRRPRRTPCTYFIAYHAQSRPRSADCVVPPLAAAKKGGVYRLSSHVPPPPRRERPLHARRPARRSKKRRGLPPLSVRIQPHPAALTFPTSRRPPCDAGPCPPPRRVRLVHARRGRSLHARRPASPTVLSRRPAPHLSPTARRHCLAPHPLNRNSDRLHFSMLEISLPHNKN